MKGCVSIFEVFKLLTHIFYILILAEKNSDTMTLLFKGSCKVWAHSRFENKNLCHCVARFESPKFWSCFLESSSKKPHFLSPSSWGCKIVMAMGCSGSVRLQAKPSAHTLLGCKCSGYACWRPIKWLKTSLPAQHRAISGSSLGT